MCKNEKSLKLSGIQYYWLIFAGLILGPVLEIPESNDDLK